MKNKVFISYSHADEKFLERLHKHMAMLRRDVELEEWTDQKILPGDRIEETISESLSSSSIFLALISHEYLSSNYCYEKEFAKAIELAQQGKMRIVSVIVEPCDWLNSPLSQFLVLPKDGKPVSEWTNQNNAFLDIVMGLRRLFLRSGKEVVSTPPSGQIKSPNAPRVRIKQDFDSIQKSEFADKTFEVLKTYFRESCEELNGLGETLKAKFEMVDNTAFTCSVVNRAKMRGGEAHITVHNMKQRSGFGGDISYVYQRYADKNTFHGGFDVEADDYNLFLRASMFAAYGRGEGKHTPEQVAETLWKEFVERAGVEYE